MQNQYAGPPTFELQKMSVKIHYYGRRLDAVAAPQAFVPLRHRKTGRDGNPVLLRMVKSPLEWVDGTGRRGVGHTEIQDTLYRRRAKRDRRLMSPSGLAGIDASATETSLRQHDPGLAAPLQIELAAGGHSNLTFRITDATGRRFALRRPPLGDLPPGAHDVLREYRILAGLQSSTVPVPKAVAECRDPEVNGAPFYVMSWVDGPIVDRIERLDAVLPTVVLRREASFRLVDTLAALHQVDVDAVGLGDLGPRADYLQRQLARLYKVWQHTKTRELPIIDSLYERLQKDCPPQRYTGTRPFGFSLRQPDLECRRYAGGGARLELCDGDVLVDLGFLLANWDLPDDPWPDVWMEVPPTRAGGFPTRAELVARYVAATGWDVSRINYYRAFVLWRIAVIAEGIKRRYASGALGAKQSNLDALSVECATGRNWRRRRCPRPGPTSEGLARSTGVSPRSARRGTTTGGRSSLGGVTAVASVARSMLRVEPEARSAISAMIGRSSVEIRLEAADGRADRDGRDESCRPRRRSATR